MKTHSIGFKNAIKELGRELRATITYNDTELEEEIYAVNPHFEGNILKSVMKQLDLELSVDIPLNTVINCKIGILVNGNYEMLNFGNYVVYNSEKQEDTNTYKLTCYDKLLYSMKQNEELQITYPISIKDYLNAIANKIGLSVESTTFYNESMMIQNELYLGLDYTYRDILDEIAQATGSIICLNENDEIVVKYPTQTDDIIDEEFLKDVNVNFGQKYGVINSIVLSRSGESDNIYLSDEESVAENGLTEVKIVDNQIMNWNDRSDYLEGLLLALNGLYYYINDFSSTGIMYYEVGDLYNVEVGQKTYQCLMLNDEIEVTTGIEETIYTDLSEQSETDYTKADKTDRRINQTYLIVDKQNQEIESIITTQTDQNQKIARVVQTVDELNSKISDIADITTSLESNSGRLEFEDINQSEPIRIVVHPIGVNISKLYPNTTLKSSTNLTIKTRIVRFTNNTTTESWDYELPDDLLYYDNENYDEFILDYDSQTCIVNKKCKWNNDGTVGLLENERTDEYSYPLIYLSDGDYTVSLIQYSNAYLFARLMAQNIYTTQFATKAEVNSEISQTAQSINLSVDSKLSNYSTTTQMNSAITQKANEITSTVSSTYETKNNAQSKYSQLQQTDSNISSTVATKVGNNEIISKINQSSEAVTINANKINLSGTTIDMTSQNIKINSDNFKVDKNGNMSCNDATITGGKINLIGGTETSANFQVISSNNHGFVKITPFQMWINGQDNENVGLTISRRSNNINSSVNLYSSYDGGSLEVGDGRISNFFAVDGINKFVSVSGPMYANSFINNSSEKIKKNIDKFNINVLEIIKKSDLYTFNYNMEDDNTKKHIGFIIGNDYRTPNEVISENKQSIDMYSMISVAWKAIQEQQEQIEELQKEIKELKGGK